MTYRYAVDPSATAFLAKIATDQTDDVDVEHGTPKHLDPGAWPYINLFLDRRSADWPDVADFIRLAHAAGILTGPSTPNLIAADDEAGRATITFEATPRGPRLSTAPLRDTDLTDSGISGREWVLALLHGVARHLNAELDLLDLFVMTNAGAGA